MDGIPLGSSFCHVPFHLHAGPQLDLNIRMRQRVCFWNPTALLISDHEIVSIVPFAHWVDSLNHSHYLPAVDDGHFGYSVTIRYDAVSWDYLCVDAAVVGDKLVPDQKTRS